MKRFLMMFAVLLAGGAAAFGYTNVLENGDSQTITNGWDAGGDMIVGNFTSNNTLTIVGGGSLTNINAFVGAQAGASNNTANVSGTGAEWINTGTLQVGFSGNSNNVVSVFNGGTISAAGLTVYTNNTFNLDADGNLEIDGAFNAGQSGFNWNDGGHLSVGGQLYGLAVTNLNDAAATIFDGEDKSLTLDGGNALWNHGGNQLIVGLEGSGNQLTVTNGGRVFNADAFVGYSDAAHSNSVLVTGTNSLWSVNGSLTVGSTNNAGNSATVADGGTISAATLVVNSNNTFNLDADGNLGIGGDFDAGQGGFNWTAGQLDVGGDLTGMTELDGTDKSLVIDGGSWTTNSDLTIGLIGSGNRLTIQNGGVVSNANAFVGQNAGADSNTVTVTGANSLWANTGTLEVGSAATNSGNVVNVENGGTIVVGGLQVYSNNTFNLNADGTLRLTGSFDASPSGFDWKNGGHLWAQSNLTGVTSLVGDDKTLTIDGGSLTNSSNELYIGWNGSGNTLNIFNGGDASVSNVFAGYSFESDGNKIVVEGSNSTLSVEDQLHIGFNGNGNSLTINAHGRVTNATAYVGSGKLSDNNTVTVSGVDATWINGQLNVGRIINETPPGEASVSTTNSGNAVTVSDGGMVRADELSVFGENHFNLEDDGTLRMTGGFNVSKYINSNFTNLNWAAGGNLSVGGALSGITNLAGGRILTLDGDGATWDLSGTNILVGGDGQSGSTLVSTNGAIVSADHLRIEGSGNVANIATNAWLLVGDGATMNSLSGGGVIVASTNGAELAVDDFGLLNIAGTLMVGAGTNEAGTVTVTNGGTLVAQALNIFATNSVFNLNNQGTLRVEGDFMADPSGFNWNEGGHLSIGGELQNLDGLLQTNRLLTLGGSNAVWNLGASNLVVGSTGSGNELRIEDGGAVTNGAGYVGAQAGASNNTVWVEGTGSHWINTGILTVGNDASNTFNSVTVADGGLVQASDLEIKVDDAFNLNRDGMLDIMGGFDASMEGFNWNKGGILSVGGTLSNMGATNLVVGTLTNAYAYLDGEHALVLSDGGIWDNGLTNLIVGFESSNTALTITNGASAINADGYIGWGNTSANNSVLVSGTNSTWRNQNDLYVGAFWNTASNLVNAGVHNSLVVESNAWVFVGDVTTNALGAGATNGGMAVASSTGAELVVGNGAVSVDSLYVGAGSGLTGRVDVLKDGSITLNKLVIESGLGEFNLAGGLTVTTNFDASINGFSWLDEGDIIMDGGALTNLPAFGGTNKTVKLVDGSSWNPGDLVVGTYGSGNKLTISSNSVVASTSGVIGSSNAVNTVVEVEGSQAIWRNTGTLTVGDQGYGNRLIISDGGFVTNGTAYIGFSATASNNYATVDGSNSVWGIGGDLYVGHAGSNSMLTLSDNGTVRVDNDLYIQNNSTLTVGSTNIFLGHDMKVTDSFVVGAGTIRFNESDNMLTVTGTNSTLSADILFDGGGGTNAIEFINNQLTVSGTLSNRFVNFNSLLLEESTLSGSGTLDGIPSITLDGGFLAPTGALKMDGEFTAINQPLLKLTASEGSLELTNTNVFDLSTMDAEVTIRDGNNPSGFNAVILTADGGVTNDFASVEFIEHFLLYDFALTNDATAVSVVSEAALEGEIGSAVEYAGIQGIRAGFNGMQNAAFVRTKQLRRNTVATDHAISHEAYLMQSDDAPSGPQGPGDQNTIFGMHFWAEQFSGQGDYDAMGNSDGFTLNNNGTTFGFDKLIGDSLVAGVNYTYARSSASAIGGDRAETETYWLGLYGEWVGKADYYLEGLFGLGRSDYNTVRTDGGYRGEGSFSGNDIGVHLEGGKYFHRNSWAVAPYVGLNYLWIKSDAYTETDLAGGLSVSVDEATATSLESALGIKLRNRFDTKIGRFQTVGYAEWAYDFINDDMGSTLSDGTVTVGTARIAPGASLLNAGLGFSWICTDYLEVGLGYDGRFNENYEEHMGSAMLDVRF